jgi:hypothetical protein
VGYSVGFCIVWASKPGARRIANGDGFSPVARALTGGRDAMEGGEPIVIRRDSNALAALQDGHIQENKVEIG